MKSCSARNNIHVHLPVLSTETSKRPVGVWLKSADLEKSPHTARARQCTTRAPQHMQRITFRVNFDTIDWVWEILILITYGIYTWFYAVRLPRGWPLYN